MSEIICYKVISVNSEGIILKNRNSSINILFEDCVNNYIVEKAVKTSTCIATRDITQLSFTFYTKPKTKIIFRRNFVRELISGKSAVGEFLDLQKSIIKSGYTSYDLS